MGHHELGDASKLTPAERKAEFATDRLATTYHTFGTAGATEVRGRFADVERAEMAARGQAKPASGPWADPLNEVMNSAPDVMGYLLDQQPVNGTTLEESLGMTEEAAPARKGRDR